MATIETDFEMTLEREDDDVSVYITAEGEIDPRDPSVGIMADGIAYVTITSATDEDGKTITLTASESNAVERKASEKLEQKLESTGAYDEE